MKQTYEVLKHDEETCFTKMAQIFNRPEDEIKRRLRKHKLFVTKKKQVEVKKPGKIFKAAIYYFI